MKSSKNHRLAKVEKYFRAKFLIVILAGFLLILALFFRLYDWQGRSGGFYGDKARDIFVSGLIAEGQSIHVGHSASGLSNPYIHYPPYYYIFLSLFWKIGKSPFNVLFLIGIWHSVWVIFFFLFVYKVKKDLKLATLIGFWYASAHLWVSATYEVVGVWVAYPLFFTWLLLWFGYEETKKVKYLVASGIVAAIVALFHYSIVPAVVAQFVTLFFFGIFDKKDKAIKINHSFLFLFSFLSAFIVAHLPQFQYYGITNVLHSWMYSGSKVTTFEFLVQLKIIFLDQMGRITYPNFSLSAGFLFFFISIFLSIYSSLTIKKIWVFLSIFAVFAATRKEYFDPYFTPGLITLSFLILIVIYKAIVTTQKNYFKLIIMMFILLLFLYTGSSYITVKQWKNTEMSSFQQISHKIKDSLNNYQFRIFTFDEDPYGWDTSILAIWLWNDLGKNWFQLTNSGYNYEYTVSTDITILFCSRRNGKSCVEFWNQYIKWKGYSDFKTKKHTEICNHESLILCKVDCPEVLANLATIQKCDID